MRRIRKIPYFFYPGSYAILDKKTWKRGRQRTTVNHILHAPSFNV